MPDDACILMIGARHTGKSVLLTDIMHSKKNRLDLVFGMSPTEEANETLSQFTHRGFIYDEYNNKALQDVMEWQKRCCATDKRNKGQPGYVPKTIKAGLVLDDCMSEKCDEGRKKKKVMQSADIDRLFKLGRHYKLFFICAMQYIIDAPPGIRGNVDFVFAFHTNSGSEKEKLHKEYFNMFTYKQFCEVFETCVTEKYNCIVLDVRRSRDKPGSGIYYYKAIDRTSKAGCAPFHVGKPIFKRLADYFFVDRAVLDLDAAAIRGFGSTSTGAGAGASGPAGAGAGAGGTMQAQTQTNATTTITSSAQIKPEFVIRRHPATPSKNGNANANANANAKLKRMLEPEPEPESESESESEPEPMHAPAAVSSQMRMRMRMPTPSSCLQSRSNSSSTKHLSLSLPSPSHTKAPLLAHSQADRHRSLHARDLRDSRAHTPALAPALAPSFHQVRDLPNGSSLRGQVKKL